MLLQYLFIHRYRNIENQGFNLSGRFNVNSSDTQIEVTENPFYIHEFFGTSVQELKVIVGQNGVGKTTILDFIKEELCFPSSQNDEATKCWLILFDAVSRRFLLVTNGLDLTNLALVIPTGYRKQVRDITKRMYRGEESLSRDSILGNVSEFNPSSVILLSNIFDNRTVRNYGPPTSPIIYDLTTNNLLKEIMTGEIKRPLKTTMIYNSIKFILSTRENDFIPVVHLPREIKITFNRFSTDDFIRRRERNKKSEDLPLIEFLSKTLYQNKTERLKYWLYGNLLIEISEYVNADNMATVVSRLKGIEILQDDAAFFETLLKSNKYFTKSRRADRRKFDTLNKSFSWKRYITSYREFTNQTIELFQQYDKNDDDFESFSIPLSPATEKKVRAYTNLLDGSELSITKVTLSWNDLSTGETMLLNFFSALYVMSRKKQNEMGNSILFMFDEIDSYYHPQWQKKLMKALLDFINFYFSSYRCQIIATAHSPIIVSDIPKSNVLFLRRVEKKTMVQDNLDDHLQTFAANVHALLSDSFFITNGHIGDFANEKISEVIDLLVNKPLNQITSKRKYIESVINIIGEDVIRNKLLELLERRLRANLISIKEDIQILKKRR
jgi:predicted ATPase